MSDVQFETLEAELINHMLAPMLNEHGAQGWELVDVDGETATLRRPLEGAVPWQYATVPLVPAARQAILDQWVDQGYELVVERDRVGYFKRPREA